MDKQTFTEILEVALLSFDGVGKEVMVEMYKINPKIVLVGINLCLYLKSKEMNLENTLK